MLKIYFFILIILLVSCSNKSQDHLSQIIDERVIRVGMDLSYPPFETTDKNNKPYGISVDIANYLAEYLTNNVSKKGKPIKAKIIDTDFSNLIPALNQGSIDIIIGSMSITEQRQKSIDFSNPYMYFKIISLLNKKFVENNFSDINTLTVNQILDSNKSKFVGLISQVSSTIPQSKGKPVFDVNDVPTAIKELLDGNKANVFIMSPFSVVRGHNSHPKQTLVMWDPFLVSPIGMGIKKGQTNLLKEVNNFIATIKQPQGVKDKLKHKWDSLIKKSLNGRSLDFYFNE